VLVVRRWRIEETGGGPVEPRLARGIVVVIVPFVAVVVVVVVVVVVGFVPAAILHTGSPTIHCGSTNVLVVVVVDFVIDIGGC